MRLPSSPLIRFTVFLCALMLCLTGCQAATPPSIHDPSASETHVPTESETLAPPPLTPLPVEVHDSSLPILWVTTEGQAPILSRVNYLQAEMTVIPAYGGEPTQSLACQIRGRGHSSFQYSEDMTDYRSKNSYRIKLDQKAALLPTTSGGSDRDWILISCKYDASALRNHLVWDLARRMGSFPYVPAYTWVELYLNGDYRGLYLLTEQIEVSSKRVDIDESACADPLQVGYLLEYDFRGDIETDAREGLTYFYLPDTDVEWVVKSEVYTEVETAAIRAHLLSCHEAILSGDRDRMEELIDLPSFVDMFILQELSKNPDVGTSSFFVQRDAGGKLYLTAPWDFDLGFGTYSTGVSPLGLVTTGNKVPSHPWFAALIRRTWFVEAVQARMEEIRPLLDQTLATPEALSPLLTPAADRNDGRWGIYGENYAEPVNERASARLNDYGDHVDFLLKWVQKRRIAMENALLHAHGKST